MLEWYVTDPEVLIGRYSPATHQDRTVAQQQSQCRVAAFDLDHTLTISRSERSGKPKLEDSNDWTWWHQSIPSRLRQAHNEGYDLVIITNQGRLTKSDGTVSPKAAVFKKKAEAILTALDLPITIYAACANDNWRKPRIRAWDHLVEQYRHAGREVDVESSFLVGDAAGRMQDHTVDDRHFAMNAGIGFYTPEEYFLGAPAESWEHRFCPADHCHPFGGSLREISEQFRTHGTTLFLFVGLPGSGKSTLYFDVLEGLGHVRVDTFAHLSLDSCVRETKELLMSGKSVVVDGVHSSQSTRKLWLSLAQDLNIPIKAIYMSTQPDVCAHNDAVRALGGVQREPEPRSIFLWKSFWSLVEEFEEPVSTEGFHDIIKVDLKWSGTEEEKTIWTKFWI